MKMECEIVQSVLQDAGIEVDLETLQNPTEEFMINLVIDYLKKFNIDGTMIAKPTPEQLFCIFSEESVLNAIKAINLHAALVTICEGIFLKDLTLRDITSPGCKKACKRIKVLFNFYVYMRNKKMEKEYLFSELEERQKEFQTMIELKAEKLAQIGSVIQDRENKQEVIQIINREISEIKLQIQQDEKIRCQLQMSIDNIVLKQKEELTKLNALKVKAYELRKANIDLQNKIVQSPEEFSTRVTELKQILDEKNEERQSLKDCINRKKCQIQKNVFAESEVKNFHNKMIHFGDVVMQLRKLVMNISFAEKQIEELQGSITLLEHAERNNFKNNSHTSESINGKEQSQHLLSELHKAYAGKQREHEILKEKLKDLYNARDNKKNILEKETKTISDTENDYIKHLKEYKNLFDKELDKEIDLRLNIKNFT